MYEKIALLLFLTGLTFIIISSYRANLTLQTVHQALYKTYHGETFEPKYIQITLGLISGFFFIISGILLWTFQTPTLSTVIVGFGVLYVLIEERSLDEKPQYITNRQRTNLLSWPVITKGVRDQLVKWYEDSETPMAQPDWITIGLGPMISIVITFFVFFFVTHGILSLITFYGIYATIIAVYLFVL